jgi:hypothetical protein
VSFSFCAGCRVCEAPSRASAGLNSQLGRSPNVLGERLRKVKAPKRTIRANRTSRSESSHFGVTVDQRGLAESGSGAGPEGSSFDVVLSWRCRKGELRGSPISARAQFCRRTKDICACNSLLPRV